MIALTLQLYAAPQRTPEEMLAQRFAKAIRATYNKSFITLGTAGADALMSPLAASVRYRPFGRWVG